jgi:hypothetical protein
VTRRTALKLLASIASLPFIPRIVDLGDITAIRRAARSAAPPIELDQAFLRQFREGIAILAKQRASRLRERGIVLLDPDAIVEITVADDSDI